MSLNLLRRRLSRYDNVVEVIAWIVVIPFEAASVTARVAVRVVQINAGAGKAACKTSAGTVPVFCATIFSWSAEVESFQNCFANIQRNIREKGN